MEARTLHAHELDPHRPNPARMYDYYLGGFHNFEADREAAEAAESAFPGVRAAARANRDFVRRAVRYLVGEGIDQFLDLGSGVPTAGNVHEVAQALNPDARVVYVDAEPVVVHAGEALLANNDRARILHADIRHAEAVLGASEVEQLLRLDRPLGLIMASVLPHIPDCDDPDTLVARYVAALAPGSYLVLSHGSIDDYNAAETGEVYDVYRAATSPITSRPAARLTAWFDGLDLVEPGVVVVTHWHPERGDVPAKLRIAHHGGVARVPWRPAAR
ncbi:SAM-dependent methyltransferase [Actinocrinis puniceicyclus]|uniref:SAM-dependent methyltransferase n=1 Tax=Actinocrinis puniceicyclus TaxID=977794 RepID=A0A8J7WLQ3_9ACTN|nr:SAM-dependent methyltransferase [Actinocrinis puniceicyclus]MBS2963155.1 SAM-dependent methyltransferase [Actinocrinis puniceicyclus]